jgi:hypothetical protein
MGEKSADQLENVKQILSSIDQTLKKVEGGPEVTVDRLNIKDLLQKAVGQTRQCASDVETISQTLDPIRRQIIDPVNKKIQETSRSSVSWTIGTTLLGILIGWFLPTLIPRDSKDSIGNEGNEKNRAVAILKGSDELRSSLGSQTKMLLERLEKLILSTDKDNTKEIVSILDESRKLVGSEGAKMGSDVLSQHGYIQTVCQMVLGDTAALNRLEELSHDESLQKTDYGYALGLYIAERSAHSFPEKALEEFRKLKQQNARSNRINVLSPDLKRIELVSVIAEKRISELETLIEFRTCTVWIFDSQRKGQDHLWAKELSTAGLKAFAKGGWKNQQGQPCLYYRDKSLQHSDLTKRLVSLISLKNLQVQNPNTPKTSSVRKHFDQQKDLKFLLLL